MASYAITYGLYAHSRTRWCSAFTGPLAPPLDRLNALCRHSARWLVRVARLMVSLLLVVETSSQSLGAQVFVVLLLPALLHYFFSYCFSCNCVKQIAYGPTPPCPSPLTAHRAPHHSPPAVPQKLVSREQPRHSPPAVPLTTHHSPPTTHHSPPTTHHPPPAVPETSL